MTLIKILLVLIVSALPLPQIKTQGRDAISIDNLKGNVKVISVKEGTIREVSGKIREKCCYFSHRNIYDINGNILDIKASIPPIDYGPANPLKKEAKYDDKGNIVEELTYNPDGSPSWKIVFAYDANGNKIEESIYFSNGKLHQKGISTYNARKNLSEYEVHYADGTPFTRETYSKHDIKGNWLKQIVWRWNSQDKQWEPDTVRYRTITYY
jgi:hypothetical protein